MMDEMTKNLGTLNLVLCGVAMVFVMIGFDDAAVLTYALASAVSVIFGLGCITLKFMNKK